MRIELAYSAGYWFASSKEPYEVDNRAPRCKSKGLIVDKLSPTVLAPR